MRGRNLIFIFYLNLIVAICLTQSYAENWPTFRGQNASGLSKVAGPLDWDVETNKNINWKTAIPGLGLSSPIVFGNSVFLTTAVSQTGDEAELKVGLYGNISPADDNGIHTWNLICLDKQSGEIRWNREATKGKPKVKRHPKSSHANCSAAANADYVVAFFGSEGLYCYDHEGELKWQKSFGTLDSGYFLMPMAQWGFASSPVIFEDKVFVQCDVQKGSFLACFDLATGKEIWKTARDEVPTWGTPTPVTHGGKTQLVVNGFKHIGGYDINSGEEIWKLVGGGDIPVPTPVFTNERIFITNAHGQMAPIYAIHPSASGDITPKTDDSASTESIVWWKRKHGSYMQTPIGIGENIYLCRDSGVISCYQAKTGKLYFRKRLRDGASGFGFTASPVSDGEKIYFCTEDGFVIIINASETLQVLGKRTIGEKCMASPALVDGTLFVRGRHSLFAIGK